MPRNTGEKATRKPGRPALEVTKERRWSVGFDPDDSRRLEALAAREGQSVAGLLRQLAKRELARVGRW